MRSLVAVLFVVATAVPRAAQAQEGVSFTVKVAIDPSIGGLMHAAGSGLVDGSSVTIEESTWKDTHSEKAPLFVAGLGVPVASSAEVLANFEYGRVGATGLEIGTVDGLPLRAAFDKYQFWGLETGLRVGRATGAAPYAIATVGFRRVDAISGSFGADGQIAFASLYASSTVPTIGFGGGMLFGGPDIALGFEVMVKYAGALKQDPLDLQDTGLQSLNTEGERWSLPISFVIRF